MCEAGIHHGIDTNPSHTLGQFILTNPPSSMFYLVGNNQQILRNPIQTWGGHMELPHLQDVLIHSVGSQIDSALFTWKFVVEAQFSIMDCTTGCCIAIIFPFSLWVANCCLAGRYSIFCLAQWRFHRCCIRYLVYNSHVDAPGAVPPDDYGVVLYCESAQCFPDLL